MPSCCFTNSVVTRSTHPSVALSKQPDRSTVRSSDFPSAVCRTVIDYNKFQVFESLAKDAIDRFRDIRLAIVGRDYDGNGRSGICHAGPLRG